MSKEGANAALRSNYRKIEVVAAQYELPQRRGKNEVGRCAIKAKARERREAGERRGEGAAGNGVIRIKGVVGVEGSGVPPLADQRYGLEARGGRRVGEDLRQQVARERVDADGRRWDGSTRAAKPL